MSFETGMKNLANNLNFTAFYIDVPDPITGFSDRKWWLSDENASPMSPQEGMTDYDVIRLFADEILNMISEYRKNL